MIPLLLALMIVGQTPLDIEKVKLHPIFAVDTAVITEDVPGPLKQSLKPDKAQIALSVRNPKDDVNPFDFEVSTSAEWVNFEVDLAYERENGIRYFNYSMTGDNRLSGNWDIEYSTQIKAAAGIDRQGIRVLRGGNVFTMGGGVVASEYSAPYDAVSEFRAKFKYGSIALTTNLNDIHLWKLKGERAFGEGRVRPFIRGEYDSDNGRLDFKIKGGVKWLLN